ncbi:exonuclease domain-containing protein [Thaumasiovibrio sp. DFM-14]|uniref:3'-5' exonuclease n=1 Tax=Thaumasiovibrio sp. DFM-14 TaxID=3384792 RepID=UPI0039A0E819
MIVYLDTESTGIDDDDQIIQIGIIDIDGNVLLNTLVQCDKESHPKALEVHGITPDMLKDAPTYPEIHDKIVSLLHNKVVEAYNAPFDMRLLTQTAKCHQLDFDDCHWKARCIMRRFAETFDCKRQKQFVAAERLGVTFDDLKLHDAADDCELTRRVSLALNKVIAKFEKEEARAAKTKEYRQRARQRIEAAMIPANWAEFPYFGQANRPEGCKTLSKLRVMDLDNYEYAGQCCDTYGNAGHLFMPKKTSE